MNSLLNTTHDTANAGEGGSLDEHRDYLVRYASRRVRNLDIAETLVQETFLGALRSQHGFDGRAAVRTWLTGILRHKIADHYRATGRAQGVFSTLAVHAADDEEHSVDAVAPLSSSPARCLENRELGKVIAEALGTLPERTATVFRRAVVDGEDAATVCREMDLTPSNYWVLLHRARKALQVRLVAEGVVEASRSTPGRRKARTQERRGTSPMQASRRAEKQLAIA